MNGLATREKTRLWLLIFIGVVAPLLGQTHAREIFAPSPHESSVFAAQTPASTEENYDACRYDALDSLLAANTGVGLVDDAAKLPVGRLGNPMQVPGPQKLPATIGGRQFSGHALDQMQGRGFMPSVVENTIQQGTTFSTRAGTTGFYDSVNSVRVITDTATGRVVTVIPGAP